MRSAVAAFGTKQRTHGWPAMALAFMLIVAGCSRGDDDNRVVLDGSPRFPDVEGVVEQISVDRITLDGDRSYDVASDLASFSTYDLSATPMLHRQGQYVQIGLDGDTARWMAGIGVVVRAPGKAPVVYYNGSLQTVHDGRAIFRNGTVLTLAKGVKSPIEAGILRAEIDPARHVVRALVVP
ncbi:MAG: hypothetical protein ACRD0O_16755 [Acidimicrobiia bacterium]